MYEACYPPYKTEAFDGLTHYTDNLDYAMIGVNAGKLKAAYEGAYNILDKIAFFVNDYLELRMPERNVSFRNVWRERDNKPLRQAILDLNDRHLLGLHDLSRDLSSGGYWYHLTELRNRSTHRYLVPHLERMSWQEEVDDPGYHLGYRELLDRTVDLMRLGRNAIVYLVAFIDRQERLKWHDATGVALPLLAFAYRRYPIRPQDSPT